MKKLFLSLMAFSCLAFQTMAQDSPGDHMSKINSVLAQTKDEYFAYLKAISNGRNAKKVDAKRLQLIEQISQNLKDLGSVGSYKQDNSFKEAAKSYSRMIRTIMKEDYGKIMDLEEIAEQSYDDMEALLTIKELASEKLRLVNDSFDLATKTFAATYNVNLVEPEGDKMSKKIERMATAIKYQNQAYLITLKLHHQEKYVLSAIEKGDVNSIQQNINALSTLADESLPKVAALNPHNGDSGLKIATKQMVEFYKKEVTTDFPKILDFFIKKDNFEKAKKNLDSKSQKERTKEDVDSFNKAVNEYNAAVKTFNDQMNKAFEARKKANADWEQKANAFLGTHSK